MAVKIIDVFCKNGHRVFGKYKKVKSGFLMKCYIDMIGEDCVGTAGLPNETDVLCPTCKVRIGRIGMRHGRPAVIINHGGVKQIKT